MRAKEARGKTQVSGGRRRLDDSEHAAKTALALARSLSCSRAPHASLFDAQPANKQQQQANQHDFLLPQIVKKDWRRR